MKNIIYEKQIKPGMYVKFSGPDFSYIAKILKKRKFFNHFSVEVKIISSIRDVDNKRNPGKQFTLNFNIGMEKSKWEIISKSNVRYPKCSKCQEF